MSEHREINFKKSITTATRVAALVSSLSLSSCLARPPPLNLNEGRTPSPTTSVNSRTEYEQEIIVPTTSILSDYLSIVNNRQSEANNADINKLNDSNIRDEDFIKAIEEWQANIPIFPFLRTPEAKAKFIRYVIDQDDLKTHQYIGGAPSTDKIISKDGKLYDETGKEIEEKETFTCFDFAQEMRMRYGLGSAFLRQGKLQLPLFEVNVCSGENKSVEQSGGHNFNAIYLGDTMDGIVGRDNWLFIEPQNGSVINDPMTSVNGYINLIIHLSETRKNLSKINNPLVSFFAMPDNTWQPIDEVEYGILDRIRNYVSIVKFNNMYHNSPTIEPVDLRNYEIGDIEDVVRYSVTAGYFSKDQIMTALEKGYLPQNFDMAKLQLP